MERNREILVVSGMKKKLFGTKKEQKVFDHGKERERERKEQSRKGTKKYSRIVFELK